MATALTSSQAHSQSHGGDPHAYQSLTHTLSEDYQLERSPPQDFHVQQSVTNSMERDSCIDQPASNTSGGNTHPDNPPCNMLNGNAHLDESLPHNIDGHPYAGKALSSVANGDVCVDKSPSHVLRGGSLLDLPSTLPTGPSQQPISFMSNGSHSITRPKPPINPESLPRPHDQLQKEAWRPPPSSWTTQCHHLADEVGHRVEEYFLQNWLFPSEKSRAKFLAAGFSRVTCLYFPLAKDDRIECACQLLTVLFLIDDQLESMSLEDGRAFNEALMPIIRGPVEPNRTIPAQYILYDLWQSMRRLDLELATIVVEPTFVFMSAQTDKSRLAMNGFGPYFEYRERDVGKGLLSALMQFAMDLHLNPAELRSMSSLERYCARHISAVNDITSWEKELRASQSGHHEGSVLCSAVKVVMEETGVNVDAAKKMLWLMTREWEAVFDGLVRERLEAGCGQAVSDYMQGLEYQMSGNELWSLTTLRYHDLG